MDATTLFEMQTTLDSIRTRSGKAIQEINQNKYQNALLLLMAMILDLSNVAFDLNRHLLYRKIKE